MVKSLSARYVPVDELKIIDPDLRTFTNINKPEDLEHINTHSSDPCPHPMGFPPDNKTYK
jgi:hypothetical protein